MGKYSCEKCAKSFSQKSHYDKHLSRKKPCEIQTDKIKALIDKAVEEKIVELKAKLIPNNTENTITINITKQMDISKMSKLDSFTCADSSVRASRNFPSRYFISFSVHAQGARLM